MALPHNADHESVSPSAEVVVPIVLELTGARSVLDVGCGVGHWAAAFARRGVHATGVDGEYVRAQLVLAEDSFVSHDLTTPLRLGRTYDLVVSLEVAEHLPPRCAEDFVSSLAAHGDLILFSAACPAQSGPSHVNLRWPSYWVALFERHGLTAADVLRDGLWDDERVAWWYRQNLLLFGTPSRLAELHVEPRRPRDMAHPELVAAWLAEANRGSRVDALRRALGNRLPTRLRRLAGRALRRAAALRQRFLR